MRPLEALLRFALLASSIGSALWGCAGSSVDSDLSEEERREDLVYVASVFAERERSFTPETRAIFDARLSEIDSRVDSLSHDEFVVAIQWAVSAADNGHTEVLSHEHQRLRLPVDVEWFADGLYVIAVRPAHEALLGARVEAIAGLSPEIVLAKLDGYTPGTETRTRIISGYFLERPELLAAIGVSSDPERLTLAFLMSDGSRATRTLRGTAGPSTARADDSMRVLDGIEPLPVYLRDPEQSALAVRMPELDAVYVRINRNDDSALPEKLDTILADIEENQPRHAIVDLRLNGGGNYALTAPFAEALPGLLPDGGRLVLIVGPRTFSAGINTAAILKARAGASAVVVGESPGDDLQYWAEGGFLVLPNSGLRIHYSDGYHDWANGFDPADSRNRANPRIAALNQRYSAAAGDLEPSIQVPLTFADYAAGRDPVMERVKTLLDTSSPGSESGTPVNLSSAAYGLYLRPTHTITTRPPKRARYQSI